jgi:hypothetical protein
MLVRGLEWVVVECGGKLLYGFAREVEVEVGDPGSERLRMSWLEMKNHKNINN